MLAQINSQLIRQWLPSLAVVVGVGLFSVWYVASLAAGRPEPNLGSLKRSLSSVQQKLSALQQREQQAAPLPPLLLAARDFRQASEACGMEVKPVDGDATPLLGAAVPGYQGPVPRWRFELTSRDPLHGVACLDILVSNRQALLESALITASNSQFLVSVFGRTNIQ